MFHAVCKMFQGGRRLRAGKRLSSRACSATTSRSQSGTEYMALRPGNEQVRWTRKPIFHRPRNATAASASPLQTTTPRCPRFTADEPAPARRIPDAILHAPGTCPLPVRATSYLLGPVWGGAEKVVEFREHCELGLKIMVLQKE